MGYLNGMERNGMTFDGNDSILYIERSCSYQLNKRLNCILRVYVRLVLVDEERRTVRCK
jgi:hypothetical protein